VYFALSSEVPEALRPCNDLKKPPPWFFACAFWGVNLEEMDFGDGEGVAPDERVRIWYWAGEPVCVNTVADLRELPGTSTGGYSKIGFGRGIRRGVAGVGVEGVAARPLGVVGGECRVVFGGDFARMSRRLSAASRSSIFVVVDQV
jgi:hypothetical protein